MPEPSAKQEKEIKKEMEGAKVSVLLNSIQISLDNFDDIFSDFDVSSYHKRMLSEDFLKELQRRYIETGKGDIEVRFTLPKEKRNDETEGIVRKRLKQYFSERVKDLDVEMDKIRRNGFIHVAVGFALLSSELFIYDKPDLLIRLVGIMIVPAGWYSMYSGLEYLFDHPSRLLDRRKFLERFHKASYLFVSEEELFKNIQKAESASSQTKLNV